MKLFLSALLLFTSSATSDSAIQTDWSGGPSESGPASSWGSDFSIDTGMCWYSIPGYAWIAPGYDYVEHEIDDSFHAPVSVSPADIDGDGDLDVSGTCTSFSEIAWFENDGSGQGWTKHLVSTDVESPQSAIPTDIDSDGDLDLLVADTEYGEIAWWENSDGAGASWVEHQIATDFAWVMCARPADMDADGDQDLVAASYDTDTIAWWENLEQSGTSWSEHVVDVDFSCACSAWPADVDGNGTMDVVGTAYAPGKISWWSNEDGSGETWTEYPVDDQYDDARSAVALDLDQDGDCDIVGSARWADFITWWENLSGTGSIWEKHILQSKLYDATGVACADMDLDGDPDILGCSNAGLVTWLEHPSNPDAQWIEHDVSDSFSGALSVCSGDMDSNGSPDVLCASLNGDLISWWSMSSYFPGSGSLESSILYTGCDPDWGALLWSATTPPGTAVAFQVRASDDYAQMGDWSDTISSPFTLHGVLADNASYFQYRAILTSADPDTTPSLLEVTVLWDPLGTGQGEAPPVLELLPITPNPCHGPVSVEFGMPTAGFAELVVFDVSGRLVQSSGPAEYQPGWHSIRLEELPPGVYFVMLEAGDCEGMEGFVIL